MKNYFALSAFTALVIASAFLLVSPGQDQTQNEEGLQKFSSQESFQKFISSDTQAYTGGVQSFDSVASAELGASAGEKTAVTRSSETNIQVEGVAEPDILKNGGEKIFYSSESTDGRYYIKAPSERNSSVFQTVPPQNFSEVKQLPEDGKMFLTENSVIFLGGSVTSYSRENYTKNWEKGLNSSIVSARKINESIYLVLRKRPSTGSCMVRPMEKVSIPCTELYRPSTTDSGSTAYSIVKIDAGSGKVLEKTGFVGSGSNTVVYVSKDSIYLTYYSQKERMDVMMKFLESRGENFLDSKTLNWIEQLQSYNLSDRAMEIEVQKAIREYKNGLSEEEASQFEKNFDNAWGNYTSDRKRQLSTTGIAEFELNLTLEAQGEVPGRLNDQFSISERNENLRIATTVGGSWRFDAESANDLYVLGDNLDKKGQIQGLGLTERIYSVRYVNDKAYVVTFRRVDPFHVIDLSDPKNPELTGKLKLPGYSSYLHPLSDDRILGIGEENGSVKAVIFDVSGDEPTIEASKVLDDYYSSISNSHHAFKIDRKYEVFFLPGSNGGHVFSYAQGLEEVKYVNMTDVKRTTYVNDHLYVFSDTNVTVIDENTWDTVKQVQFAQRPDYGYVEPLPGPFVR